MSESFEIGVTLALSDGVSDGIARARQEMAALQLVLATGGVSVAQLRKTATEATALAQPRSGGQVLDGKSPATPAAVVTLDPPAMGRSLEKPAIVPAPAADATAFRRAALVGDDWDTSRLVKQAPLSEVAQPSARASIEPRDGAARLATNATSRPLAPAVPRDVVLLRKIAPQISPAAAAPKTVAPPPSELSSSRIVQIQSTSRAAAADQMGVARESWSRSGPEDGRDVDTSSRSYGSPKLPELQSVFDQRSGGVPAAPQAVGTSGHRAWREQVVQLPTAAPSAGSAATTTQTGASAPDDASPATGTQAPMGGDVYLDGMLVGRWMSRFLAQEAGRASAGPTGFDGRRGRLLPGPTVGT